MAIILSVIIIIVIIAFFSKSKAGDDIKTKPAQPYSFEPSGNPNQLIMLNPELRRPNLQDKSLQVHLKNELYESKSISHDLKDFVAFDFETANTSRYSACALGLAIVKDLEIVETKHFLISPPHNQWFIQRFVDLHGLNWEDVYEQPYFCDIWQEIKELFSSNHLIAYNCVFDRDVLTQTLNYHGIAVPKLNYSCALSGAREHIKGLYNYKLPTVCNHLNIKLAHHKADSDAKAAAHVTIHLVNMQKQKEIIRLEKQSLLAERQLRTDRIETLKITGDFTKLETIKKNIRRNKKLMQENPGKPIYKEKYIKYKDDYFQMMLEEYREKN